MDDLPAKNNRIRTFEAAPRFPAGKPECRPLLRLAVWVLTAAAVLCFAFNGRADSMEYESVSVIVNIGNLRAAPSREAPLTGKVYRGAILQVTEKQGDWYRVRRQDGVFAWAHRNILEKVAPETAAQSKNKVIEEIRFEIDKDRQERVIFLLTEFFSPETFALEGEHPRVVCDFYGARLGHRIEGPMEVHSACVKGIRFGIYDDPSPRVRVVLDLMPGKDYSVEQFFFQENNHYTVVLRESP